MFTHTIDRVDPLLKAEQLKYASVWGHPSGRYRKFSPGAFEATAACDWFFDQFPGHVNASVTDYGCGAGAAIPFLAMNFDHVSAVDIVDVTGAGPRSKVSFHKAPLWDLPNSLWRSDFAFCCDVLEHIPQEKLNLSIAAIANKTKLAGWIRVGTLPDNLGRELIGASLHLTVEGHDWWKSKLQSFFRSVQTIEAGQGFATFAVKS